MIKSSTVHQLAHTHTVYIYIKQTQQTEIFWSKAMLDLLTIFGHSRRLTFFSINFPFLFIFRDKRYWKLNIIYTWYDL